MSEKSASALKALLEIWKEHRDRAREAHDKHAAWLAEHKAHLPPGHVELVDETHQQLKGSVDFWDGRVHMLEADIRSIPTD
jgi:hypothetical protein